MTRENNTRAVSNSRHALWLWGLLTLFVLRVLGQLLVAYGGVTWLPAMPEWYSGLLPYHLLLPAQILIVLLLTRVCLDITRGRGFFAEPRPQFAGPILWLGLVYLAVMILRYPLRMYLHPEARWFGQTIPIFFHWVLAAFLILFAQYHRAALKTTARSPGGKVPASPGLSETPGRSES